MARYRKKPVEIEAFRFDFDKPDAWWHEAVDDGKAEVIEGGAIIKTLEGPMMASKGDFIIRGVKGELYPCKADIFEMSYEAA